uniref:Polyhomeotic-like protein 1 n=1 Tax=Denticeps clupeoides TaxID=299321 RepID=A0AAY4AUP3_9TELE
MEAGEEQNSGSANGSAPTGGSSRPPQIAHMSLYERQAVQALQALQRQPNAAQYFQQLMLQQQINNAQLQNLAAVQQATLAASRQSSSPSNSVSQATSTTHCTVNLSTTTAGGTMTNPRPVGPATSVTSSALSQSVLLGGNSTGQGQMYLRVNRSLRAPLTSQLIFMPGGTATAAVATVAQQPQQQQQEVTPTSSSSQSDNDQAQNLAMRCVSSSRMAVVKTEFPERKDNGEITYFYPSLSFDSTHASQSLDSTAQQLPGTKPPSYPTLTSTPSMSTANVKNGSQATNPVPGSAASSTIPPSSSPTPSLPLSQLLLSPSALCQARAVTTVTPAATVTHILVPTSSVPTSTQCYPVGTMATKANLGAQTLVVQPMQQGGVTEKLPHSATPVPIQPKTMQGHRLPVQMPPRHPPPILPAPPSNGQQVGGHHSPHVPVQLVGARQGTLGTSQALALAQTRNCCTQDAPPVGGNSTSVVAMVASVETGAGGLCLKSPQSALSVQQPSNQNVVSHTSSTSSSISNSHGRDGQNSTVAPSIGDSVFMQSQGKHVSLKRKSESDCTNEGLSESASHSCPSARDSAPPLSPAPSLDSAPETTFSSPPTLLPLPRGGGCQGDRAPLPQAVVKPQVLTHLIEGFVIQEGAEPFPVTGPVKDMHENRLLLKCEYCESFAPASQFRGTKRFCSKTCAKRYNVSCSHHFRTSRERTAAGVPPAGSLAQEGVARRRGPRRSSSEIACAKIAGRHLPVKCRSESSRSEDISSCDGEEEEEDSLSVSLSSSSSCPQPTHCGSQLETPAPGSLPLDGSLFLSSSPAHWSVEDVCRFISSLQGCEDLASQFLSQEIDGQALLLLKEEHLMSTMNIKLGPALKICASINNLRD